MRYDIGNLQSGAERAYLSKTVMTGETDKSELSNAVIKNLKAGDLFQGRILDINNNVVKILLSNSQTISAKLTDSLNLNIDRDVVFQVKENNNNQIVIKPYGSQEMPVGLLLRALDNASLKVTDKNIELVKSLIENNLPIDRETLQSASKQINTYGEENGSAIMKLHKLDIPVNRQNIEQINKYIAYEHRISESVRNISDGIGEYLRGFDNTKESIAVNRQVLEILVSEPSDDSMTFEKEPVLNEKPTLDKEPSFAAGQDESADGGVRLRAINGAPVTDTENVSVAEHTLSERVKEFASESPENLQSLKMSEKDYLKLFRDLSKVAADDENLGADIKKIIHGKDYGKLVKKLIEKNFLLNTEELNGGEDLKEKLKGMYGRLSSQLGELSSLIKDTGKYDTALMKNVTNLSDNLSFMNDLNAANNYAYMQIPLKTAEGNANGEIYVYNKRKAHKAPGEAITAFLHFDLTNLKATDIFLELNKNALRIDFTLSDKKSCELVEKHLFELKEMLNKKGYTSSVKIDVKKEDTVNSVFEEILKDDGNKNSVKRYSFDVRA